ncbi:MAG: hypothetical protein ABI869_04465 [Actinomycetota bacterium]
MRRIVLVVLVSFLPTAMVATTAWADVTRTVIHTTISYSSVDPGCFEQDTIYIQGDLMSHEVDVNGDIHYANLTTGTVTFTENGEAFLGHFSYPVSVNLKAGAPSATVTQTITQVAKGDAGHVAELHLTVHTTFVAASGQVTTDFFIFHQSCS